MLGLYSRPLGEHGPILGRDRVPVRQPPNRDRSRARFDFADKNTLFGLNTFSRRAGTRALPWQTTIADPWGCVRSMVTAAP
jgi:hypothetical protein